MVQMNAKSAITQKVLNSNCTQTQWAGKKSDKAIVIET